MSHHSTRERIGRAGIKTPARPVMTTGTVAAERQLLQSFHQMARTRLGPQATQDAVNELAARWYAGPRHTEAGIETPMEKRLRERARRDTGVALRKAQQPCSSLTRPS